MSALPKDQQFADCSLTNLFFGQQRLLEMRSSLSQKPPTDQRAQRDENAD
jgi:hypothetical protein